MASDWFARAREDLAAARHLLALEGVGHVVSYLLHQGVEKGLKGFLLARGADLRRTHDVELLLEDAVPLEPELARHEALCVDIADFHAEEKYPGALRGTAEPEVLENLLGRADQLLSDLEQLVH